MSQFLDTMRVLIPDGPYPNPISSQGFPGYPPGRDMKIQLPRGPHFAYKGARGPPPAIEGVAIEPLLSLYKGPPASAMHRPTNPLCVHIPSRGMAIEPSVYSHPKEGKEQGKQIQFETCKMFRNCRFLPL